MPKSTTSADTAAKGFTTNGTATKGSEVDVSGLSQTLQGHVDDIRSLIQCGICIRPLYEPFTIACGHTFCYDCLTNWFSSARHNKTCPDCRTPVEAQPSPAYLVRAIVQLFTSRAELLDKGETTVEHTKNQREDAEKVEKDKTNNDPREGGLFRGAFKPRLPIIAPIVDLEDNVVRCPNCSWELEEDSCCAQCGYSQDLDPANWTDGSDQWTEGEENSEMTDYYDDEVEDGFGDIDGHWPSGPYNFPRPSFYAARPETIGWRSNPHTIEDSEGEEDEEDDYDEDMDSFIDDDEHVGGEQGEYESDPSTVVGGPDHSTQDHYDESQMGSDAPVSQEARYANITMEDEASEEDESGEADSSDDEIDGLDYEDGEEDGEDDDEEDDEDPIRPPVTGQRHQRIPGPTSTLMMRASAAPWAFNRGQSSRVPRFGANREIPRDQLSNGTGSSTYNTIDISDDSDEEGPVAPTRRRIPGSFI